MCSVHLIEKQLLSLTTNGFMAETVRKRALEKGNYLYGIITVNNTFLVCLQTYSAPLYRFQACTRYSLRNPPRNFVHGWINQIECASRASHFHAISEKSYGGITILTAKVKQKSFLNFMVGWYILFLCKEPSKVMRMGHWMSRYRKEQCFHVDLQEFAEMRIVWENFKGTSFLFFSISRRQKVFCSCDVAVC